MDTQMEKEYMKGGEFLIADTAEILRFSAIAVTVLPAGVAADWASAGSPLKVDAATQTKTN